MSLICIFQFRRTICVGDVLALITYRVDVATDHVRLLRIKEKVLSTKWDNSRFRVTAREGGNSIRVHPSTRDQVRGQKRCLRWRRRKATTHHGKVKTHTHTHNTHNRFSWKSSKQFYSCLRPPTSNIQNCTTQGDHKVDRANKQRRKRGRKCNDTCTEDFVILQWQLQQQAFIIRKCPAPKQTASVHTFPFEWTPTSKSSEPKA